MTEAANQSDATGVLIVMARSPASISDDTFRRWFKSHLPEILSIPCFTSARLLEIDLFSGTPGRDATFHYMAIYDYVGDPQSAMAALAAAREQGEMDLPPWFPEFEAGDHLASWTGVPA